MQSTYPTVGAMQMPVNFRYTKVLSQGMPRHDKWDPFRMKHPAMTPQHWAKIFSPFDALDGFDERIAEKEVQYEFQAEPSDEETAELNRKLDILHNLTWNGRMARENNVKVTVTCFIPCQDRNHYAYRLSAGTYVDVSGTVLSVEMDQIRLQTEKGEKKIRFQDIKDIRNDTGIFETEWDWAEP